ncbi:hypothetical protein DPMN_113205 [Dreissena polymorpha]|uniref:Uncharacterized protein n=1 Tax=Dreissena polymorpha TaxID=45954 RepID=A0A9D4KH46_DREPO|nr:hypothetical protein DPMN_113205 [Dreissena polymorpha]
MTTGSCNKAYSTFNTLTKTHDPKADAHWNRLTDSSSVLNRRTKYCTALYNFMFQLDPSLRQNDCRPEAN